MSRSCSTFASVDSGMPGALAHLLERPVVAQAQPAQQASERRPVAILVGVRVILPCGCGSRRFYGQAPFDDSPIRTIMTSSGLLTRDLRMRAYSPDRDASVCVRSCSATAFAQVPPAPKAAAAPPATVTPVALETPTGPQLNRADVEAWLDGFMPYAIAKRRHRRRGRRRREGRPGAAREGLRLRRRREADAGRSRSARCSARARSRSSSPGPR